jgi:hypothetical protein
MSARFSSALMNLEPRTPPSHTHTHAASHTHTHAASHTHAHVHARPRTTIRSRTRRHTCTQSCPAGPVSHTHRACPDGCGRHRVQSMRTCSGRRRLSSTGRAALRRPPTRTSPAQPRVAGCMGAHPHAPGGCGCVRARVLGCFVNAHAHTVRMHAGAIKATGGAREAATSKQTNKQASKSRAAHSVGLCTARAPDGEASASTPSHRRRSSPRAPSKPRSAQSSLRRPSIDTDESASASHLPEPSHCDRHRPRSRDRERRVRRVTIVVAEAVFHKPI